MRTMVTVIALMVVITAAGITGKAMAINTGTSTTVIDPEDMEAVTRTMAGEGTADAETGSLPVPSPKSKQASHLIGWLVCWGFSGYLGMEDAGRFRPLPFVYASFDAA